MMKENEEEKHVTCIHVLLFVNDVKYIHRYITLRAPHKGPFSVLKRNNKFLTV